MLRLPFPALLGLLLTPVIASAAPPNVVLILADDMGSGDVHALNPDSKIPTPNLDRLARQGALFSDAHSPSAVCTPTRYGLLTGRYSWRGRLERGVLDGYGEPLIEPGRPTIAALLAERGYSTGVVGKWHLGLGFARKGEREKIDFTRGVSDGPHTRGFGFSFIIPASLDFPPYVFIRNGQITRSTALQSAQAFPAFLRHGPIGRDLEPVETLDDLTAEATAWILEAASRDSPFFLYFPLTAPHKPTLPHPRFVGATDLGPYGDFVAQVDWTVGQVLRALESAGAADDTLLIYTSDNGSYMYRLDDAAAPDHVSDPTIQAYTAAHHRANSIYRGTKADIWEAGHRVPFVVRWPGRVEPGLRVEETICLTDVFATLAEVAEAPLPEDAAEDSFSLVPLLEGRSWDRAPVIHHSANGMFAIRDGRWKLVAGNGSGGREKPLGEPFAEPYRLFDLAEDPREKHDRAAQSPETLERLTAELDRIRKSGRSR